MHDKVLVLHDPKADGPAILHGRLRNPGWRGRVPRAAYDRANAAHPGRFTLIGEETPPAEEATVEETPADEPEAEEIAPGAVESPYGKTVEEAAAYARTLTPEQRIRFTQMELEENGGKGRVTLLQALREMSQEEEADDER